MVSIIKIRTGVKRYKQAPWAVAFPVPGKYTVAYNEKETNEFCAERFLHANSISNESQ